MLTLFSVQTLLQVTARKTCDENLMMFASLRLITSSKNLNTLSLRRVKSIATRVQMGPHRDHILELAHFENSYHSDYTKCWEICLLTSWLNYNNFFPYLSWPAGIEGTAIHTA